MAGISLALIKEKKTEILQMFSLCGSGKYRHMFVGKIYCSRQRQLAVMQLEAPSRPG